MELESSIFYRSFFEAIDGLDDRTRLQVYDAYCRYIFRGIEPENLCALAQIVWTLMKPQIDANISRISNGKKGGRPKKTILSENEKVYFSENEKGTSENSKSNKNNNKNNNKNLNKEITKEKRPAFADVKSYCEQRNNGIDPQAFIDFYEARGWMVGKAPMKDWKAAIRTWENRRKEEEKTSTKTISKNYSKEDLL